MTWHEDPWKRDRPQHDTPSRPTVDVAEPPKVGELYDGRGRKIAVVRPPRNPVGFTDAGG